MRQYQHSILQWSVACFSPEIANDRPIRNFRFLEEALELVQAAGCTKAEALQLVDYTYGRPVGEIRQEVGGVMVTLASLCNAQGIDLEDAARAELQSIWRHIEKIRAKSAAKPMNSPLPVSPSGENAGLEISVIDGRLTISIGVKCLSNAYYCGGDDWDESRNEVKIVDHGEFIRDVMGALDNEAEDGSTPVTRLLDDAMVNAIDQGCLGVEIVEEVTK